VQPLISETASHVHTSTWQLAQRAADTFRSHEPVMTLLQFNLICSNFCPHSDTLQAAMCRCAYNLECLHNQTFCSVTAHQQSAGVLTVIGIITALAIIN